MKRMIIILFFGFLFGTLSSIHAGSLISGATGAYSNPIDYDVASIDWLSSDQPVEARIALLDFAAAYLKFTKDLGPSFQAEVKVNFSGLSAEEAMAKLEKITGAKISRKIALPDKARISLKGMDRGTNLLLKIIDLSGMTPSFETGTLVLSNPAGKP